MTGPSLFRRLRARLRYRHFDRDLAEELEAHRAMAEAGERARGNADAESRRRAAVQLGNMLIAREDTRGTWIPRVLQDGLQDGRYALRGMRRSFGFSIAAITMLTVGLGLVSGGYTVVNGLFLRGWNLPDNRDVFRATARRAALPSTGYISDGFSYGAFRFIDARAQTVEYVAFNRDNARIADRPDGSQTYSQGMAVSDAFAERLELPLQRGSGFATAAVSGLPRIVISDGIWRRVFGGDPGIIGRQVWVNQQPATVVGVTERGFDGLGPQALDVVTEIASPVSRYAEAVLTDETACCVSVAGRLRDGWTREQAREELALLTAQYRQSTNQPALTVTVEGTAPGEALMRQRGEFLVALGLVGMGTVLVLLLTCANVGNLYLARCLRRGREMALRLSLGASRGRIVRQLVCEGLVLAVIAGCGAFLTTAGVPTLLLLIDDGQPMSMFEPDWRVAAFTALGVVLTCLLISLAPALQTTRIAWRGATATISAQTGSIRKVLLAAQIAIASVLVLSAILIGRGIQHSLSVPADFALHTTTAATIEPPADGAYSTEDAARIRTTLASALEQAGLTVGLADRAPASGRGGFQTSVRQTSSEINVRVQLLPLSTSAFGVLEMRLAAGQWSSDDPVGAEAVINETLARRLWPDEQPVGNRLVLAFNDRTYTVVGVSRDAHLTGLDEVDAIIHVPPMVGLPVLLARSDPGLEPQIKALVGAIDPALTVTFTPLSQSIKETLEGALIGASIAGSLGAVALLLAVIGVFGVFSYIVEERRREIGIRLALGATRGQIASTLFRATRGAVVGGLVAGLLLSAFVAAALREFLFGLSPADPASYGAVAVVLGLSALTATAIPIHRAVRVEPSVTLKAD